MRAPISKPLRRRATPWLLTALLGAGCAHIPPDRYGVESISVEGADEMDATALLTCLATQERARVTLELGTSVAPTCGEPPFDARRVRVRMWAWPWSDWPLYDSVVLERDVERILRWYRARGYLDARVVETRVEPETARRSDIVPDEPACERRDDDEGCTARVVIVVDEGEPVRVEAIGLAGVASLSPALRRRLRNAITLSEGDRFDEALYESSKTALRTALHEAGRLRAAVSGRVQIVREAHLARVDFSLVPGPPTRVGEVTVEGVGGSEARSVLAAAGLVSGEPLDLDALQDARHAVFAMGAFSAVEIEPDVTDGDAGAPVDIVLRVRLARRTRMRFGGGIEVGTSTTDGTGVAISSDRWNLHLLGRWENRNFLGGLRRFTIEERPRLIFLSEFPRVQDAEASRPPQFGNLVRVRFDQPGFLEPRTMLRVRAEWDYGPDPLEDALTRHSFLTALELERVFLARRLRLRLGPHVQTYVLPKGDGSTSADDRSQNWHVLYFQYLATWDERDAPVRTRRGYYIGMTFQHAGYRRASRWSYLRFAPDVRGYVPLGGGLVLAGRARFGFTAIQRNFDIDGNGVDDDCAIPEGGTRFDVNLLCLGPQVHRFVGGGPTSNRGFLAQALGDGPGGGRSFWESTLELRASITRDLWMALFTDVGDVTRAERMRLNRPQMSAGFGIRYYTILGPIRFEVGWRVRKVSHFGTQDPSVLAGTMDSPGEGRILSRERLRPGAIHITIGEPF